MMAISKPVIAITMGDPAGVGPELSLRAALSPSVTDRCKPVIYGMGDLLSRVAQTIGLDISLSSFGDIDQAVQAEGSLCVIESGDGEAAGQVDQIRGGEVSSVTGRQSFGFVQRAIDDALAGRVDAVVTGPIHKRAWEMAGIPYPGHTELFAQRCGTDDFCMMMTAPKLSCSLVTCHVGLMDVSGMPSVDRIEKVIRLTRESLRKMKGQEPRLVVLGLNPHAGEDGLFGHGEEERLILPAIERSRDQGAIVEGPVPPDTAFLPGWLERTDGHVCMYHDQGLIPFKALAFDTGVNTTLGLPLVRTSVDHGTALDIAWQGVADPSSMFAAIDLAVRLSESGRLGQDRR